MADTDATVASITPIFDEIESLADMDVSPIALPQCEAFVWFPSDPTKAATPTVLEIGKSMPMDVNAKILAIHPDGDEVRIYCALMARPKGVNDDANIRHKRYTLSKLMPVFSLETMLMPTLLTEMASELQELREATILKHDLEDHPHCQECKGTGYKVGPLPEGEGDEDPLEE